MGVVVGEEWGVMGWNGVGEGVMLGGVGVDEVGVGLKMQVS